MLLKNELDLAEGLKSSTEKVGKLYPVPEDFHGNVIDGKHLEELAREIGTLKRENIEALQQIVDRKRSL